MPTASATTRTVVVSTGSGNLNVRAQPSTSAQLLGTIVTVRKMVITCFVHGQVFAGGPFGGASDIWNKREAPGSSPTGCSTRGSECTRRAAMSRPDER